MLITKKVIENCKEAIKYFKNNPDKSHYLVMRDNNERYIDFIIEKGNWYYGDKNYIYWDNSEFGFKFNEDLLFLNYEKPKNNRID